MYQFLQHSLCVLCALCALRGSSVAAEIRLREHAAPIGNIVRLGDVADLSGFASRDEWQWKLAELVPAPALSSQRMLTAGEVADLLARGGYDLTGVSIAGTQVAISWQATTTPIAQSATPATPTTAPTSGFRSLGAATAPTRRPVVFLTTEQRTAIDEHLRDIVTRYVEDQSGKIGLIEITTDMPTSDAEKLMQATSELTVTGGHAPWQGPQRLGLSMDTNRGTLHLPLQVTIRDLTPVAVVVRAAARGELLTASHVSFEPAPAGSRLPASVEPVTSVEQMVGREASRNLRVGEVLTTNICLPPMMVRRGQLVSVQAGGGGIRIARQATARADGRQGEVVELEIAGSKERLAARVIAPGQLAIVSAIAPAAPPATFDRTVQQPSPSIR